MTDKYAKNMQNWADRFKAATGLRDRSQYKIFYGHIRPAPILVLRINPGGTPEDIMPNGMELRRGTGQAAASASFYENGESDLIDCHWRDNKIVDLLTPIVEAKGLTIRNDVVKSNMAFRRSAKKNEKEFQLTMVEAKPILTEVIDSVKPSLIVLAGVKISEFTAMYCKGAKEMAERKYNVSVGQTVFWPWSVILENQTQSTLAVQVAHPSQFSWTYSKFGIASLLLQHWKYLKKESK